MCRWLAYSGSPVLVEELLYGPKNSLVVQSLHSQMGAEETNGDGFGLGWYGDRETAAVFRSIEPAWNDRNLRALGAPHVRPGLRHIAAPRPDRRSKQTNCHPFQHGRWLWMRNGMIREYHAVKRDLTLAVSPERYPDIEGTTDSEVMFHLALTFGLEDPARRRRAHDRPGRAGRPRAWRRASVPGDDRDVRR